MVIPLDTTYKAVAGVALLASFLSAPVLGRAWAKPAADAPRRILIGGDVTNRQVRGRKTEAQPQPRYAVHARAGQHLRLRVESLSAPGIMQPLVWVTPPGGEESGEKSSMFDADVARTGNYIIRIGCNRMASDRSTGPFLLKVWLLDKRPR